ncbi:MAG: hypothetical protein WCG92_11185 [Hyphomicrobiales bacterium]|nr:hypothetical protein [Alphaproteobacteria bacterium]
MTERNLARKKAGRLTAGRPFATPAWYVLVALGGFGFGLIADRRPFGDDILLHPVVVFYTLVGLGLLALRVALARPVPEVIADRTLMLGCALGLAMFLAGNFVGAHMLLFRSGVS